MIRKEEFCDVNFWFALSDAGLSVEDISKLIVEVPKAPQLISIIVERDGRKFIFKNYGNHIDCIVVGVIMKTIYRLLK